MKFWVKVRRAIWHLWQRLNLRFFWQVVFAFVTITLITSLGMYLVGRSALNQTRDLVRANPSPLDTFWADRLARYYTNQGSWDGVETMLESFPEGPAWEPVDLEWRQSYILMSPDGEVLASSTFERLGEQLGKFEQSLSMPILVDDEEVGRILLTDRFPGWTPPDPALRAFPLGRLPFSLAERLGLSWSVGWIAERLLSTSIYITLIALVVAVILSRGISRPVSEITKATRGIAAGDLEARVSTQHAGEIGQLATAFNQMAEALAHADTLRRNMTADVAHELRTPLSVIRGKLEGIVDGVYPATPEQLQPVLEEVALLTQLVEDLRLLAQAEAGQLAVDKRLVDVGDLLRDAHVNFSPQAADRGVTLALELPEALPPVSADWRRIAQVLGNLMINALRHTSPGGTVTLAATEVAEGVAVSVSDTGTGIASADLPYIFERFWRGDKSRARFEQHGGTGLGLSIAKQLLALHGSDINVESAVGVGTTFWFTLPKS